MAKSKQAKPTTKEQRGFTMIELSLVMAFVAFLLIAIAIITTNIITIYQKGSALKAVNSVGRGLVDEFIAAINQAPSVDTTSLCNSLVTTEDGRERCINDAAFKFIFQAEYGDVADDNNIRKQYNGIFCTGYYSYYWNTEYGEAAGRTISLRYARDNTDENKDILHQYKDNDEDEGVVRLARIEDRTYQLCAANVDGDYGSTYRQNLDDNRGVIDIRSKQRYAGDGLTIDNFLSEAPQEGFLNAFDLDLTLYELTIFPTSQDWVTLRTFMSGTFILATYRGNVDITRTGDYCDLGSYEDAEGNYVDNATSIENLGAEFNYCAINKFNFSTRTAGSGV